MHVLDWLRMLARKSLLADLIVVGAVTVDVAAETHGTFEGPWHSLATVVLWLATAFFATEVGVRLGESSELTGDAWRGAVAYLRTPSGWIDALATLALPVATIVNIDPTTAHLMPLVSIFKLGEHSSGLKLLARVARNSGDPLLSVFLGFIIIFVVAATLAYLAERSAQPEQFGSIPRAMWWAIVTITTTGYGDAIPASLTGRTLAGAVMICGIGVFALWAGILASGFGDELQRRQFLRTWDLVAKVPFFSRLGAAVIAEVARLLKHHDVGAGQTIFREGQPGETMYFIVSGVVEVRAATGPIYLRENEFFGEMALLSGARRIATVVAVESCDLLELGAAEFRQFAASRPELMRAISEESERRVKDSAPA